MPDGDVTGYSPPITDDFQLPGSDLDYNDHDVHDDHDDNDDSDNDHDNDLF